MKTNECLLAAVGFAFTSLALLISMAATVPFAVVDSVDARRVIGGACYWTDVVSCSAPGPMECPFMANNGQCGNGDYLFTDERWVARTSLTTPGWTNKMDMGKVHCYETYSCTPMVIGSTTYCFQGSWISNSLEHDESFSFGGETCNNGA